MSTQSAANVGAGTVMARWSLKAWLCFAGVLLVGGAVWYARAATIPLIVAALISTQLIPLVVAMTGRGLPRGLAITASMILVLLVAVGLAWVFTSELFGNLSGVGQNVSDGADKVVVWLRDHNDWIKQNQEHVRDFLKGILPAAKSAVTGIL